MLHSLKKTFGLIALSSILCCLPVTGLAQTEEPVIVLKSSIYETHGESNSFQILIGGIEEGDYIDVDCGFGTEEHELEKATYDSSTGSWSGTLITCNVSKEGIVKIYGNASNIDVFNASGCYLRSADFFSLTNLEILDLSHNELEALDLTNFNNLQALYLNDNPFNVKPLIVGGNKPGLIILEMGQIDNLDRSFNLSDYPELVSFNAWSNKSLMKLDPTGCPKLRKISIDSTPVSELDVTKNTELSILNISDTGISEIDLSKNVNLTQFFCDHLSSSINSGVKLTSLDVTKNPNLVYLYASGNALSDIDVSQNKYLHDLFLNKNNLSSINLDNNPNLIQVSLRYNNLNFATLPIPDDSWSTYEYVQKAMPVAKSQKVGTVLDLSDKVLRDGTTTTAALYMTRESEPGVITPLGEEYYTYADGKVTLLKAVSDSVYLAFANSAFPVSALTSQPLCTSKFMVKTEEDYGKDDIAFSFVAIAQSSGTPVSFKLGMDGATADNPKTFYVDYGDGRKVEYHATSASVPSEPNVLNGKSTTGRITVYVPENELVTAIDIENIPLSSISLDALRSLKTLRLAGTELYSIDLGWNRGLTSLELTGNHFSTLNIRGANDYYQKNLLHDINLSNNGLTSVTLNDNYTIHNLNLSNNQLTELSFKDADLLKTLDVSNNRLETIDVNYCTLMTSLNIAGNNISSIVLPAENSLSSLHCENNALDFTSLPTLPTLTDYNYAPQNEVQISTIGPGTDLSWLNLNEKTVYVWKKENGTELVKGTDYTEENGKTRFMPLLIGSNVYCEMTNPAYDKLTLRTSLMEVAGMPTNVFATFTTTEDQTASLILVANANKTPVYIDWKGDGVELAQYSVGTSPTQFTVTTYKNAEVKVYSYDEVSNLTVFSISGATMSQMDVSDLKQLTCLSVNNAGLSDIKLPDSDNLYEIYLDGNNFSSINLKRYAGKLRYLTLNKNNLTTFDASVYPKLNILAIGDNQLSSVKLNNQELWQLTLSGNKLSEIDLTNVPNIENLALGHNELTNIDVSKLSKLHVLFLDANKFKFSTLPPNNDYSLYTYDDQAALDVKVEDGKVDISSEAVIDGIETTYRWFVDKPVRDDYGELTGEELYIGDEYTLNNGVTTFIKPIDNVMCVMTNNKFPNVVLYTPLMDITTTGIDYVAYNGKSVSVKVVDNRIRIKAEDGIPVRLNGINGTLVFSSTTVNGECEISGIASGVYVITIGNSSYKIVVK